jgi:hypothetical protein
MEFPFNWAATRGGAEENPCLADKTRATQPPGAVADFVNRNVLRVLVVREECYNESLSHGGVTSSSHAVFSLWSWRS